MCVCVCVWTLLRIKCDSLLSCVVGLEIERLVGVGRHAISLMLLLSTSTASATATAASAAAASKPALNSCHY